MTEQEAGGALDWLKHNIDTNKEAGKQLDLVDAAPCDWNDYIALLNPEEGKTDELGETKEVSMDVTLARTNWDLIIGSDLVYNEAGVKMLPAVMKALASPQTHIYYAHTKKRYEMVDFDFFAELSKLGFTVEEVREKSISTPPESPPAFEYCFPPMRIAVYHITLPEK